MTYKTKRLQIRSGFCNGLVFDTRGGFPCSRKGKFEEDGKLWCFQHQPSKEKARREENARKWKEHWDAKQAKWSKQDRIRLAEENLVEGCLQLDPIPPGLEWLEMLIKEVRKARYS